MPSGRCGARYSVGTGGETVKRYKVSNRLLIVGKDAPADLDLRNVEIVLASDYDALEARVKVLEAELAEARKLRRLRVTRAAEPPSAPPSPPR